MFPIMRHQISFSISFHFLKNENKKEIHKRSKCNLRVFNECKTLFKIGSEVPVVGK